MVVTRKKALLLGGTGALGVYLAPQMIADGFDVVITSRSDREDSDHIHYIKGDALDIPFLNGLFKDCTYDVVVDFMIYSTTDFLDRYQLLLENCTHYIYVSSYRVFSDANIITEKTPRLLDISKDAIFLKTTDYSLEKARQEDVLRQSRRRNWTIIRPSITYSKERFQLGTLEADTVVERSLESKPVIFPREMLNKQTTMTWAGDVAKMISALAANNRAMGEDFNVVTSEHRAWSEVTEIYKDNIGLKLVEVSKDEYIDALGGGYARYQVDYDRMFDRVMDNSKILKFTGLKQDDLMTPEDGLKMELSNFKKNPFSWPVDYGKKAKIDRLTGVFSQLTEATKSERRVYLEARFPRIGYIMAKMSVKDIREKLRMRTQIKNLLRVIKHKTRIRTRIRDAKERVLQESRRRKFNKLDGGIITLIDYNNYGNIIQRYALQEFLLRNGYPFVSYEHDLPIVNDLSDGRVQFTAEFVRRHIFTQTFSKEQNLSRYIVGSDQIWRDFSYEYPKEQLGFFFLDFLKKKNAKRIAYAASFGRNSLKEAKITPELSAYIDPYIRKFDAVSVREKTAVDMVSDAWGVDAEVVIDPTMLLSAEEYSNLISRSIQKIKPIDGIFTYLIGVSDENERFLKKASDFMKKDLYRIDLADYSGPLPPVEQWLCGLRDADLAVVDSFHGAVFSIINNTNFVVLENKGSGMERMVNLLELFGIEGRVIKHGAVDDFSFENISPIDWVAVNEKLAKLRSQSSKWLIDAVQSK